jgi:glycosyltransferase involved in cell wall biosynthesis
MLVKRGLLENGIEVVEVNAHVPISRLDQKKDMGVFPLFKRILKKIKLLPITVRQINDVRSSDIIYVGYPGHFDVVPAFILAKIFGKKLFFNPLIIFYTGFVEEQGILSPHSFLARLLLFAEGVIYRMCDVVLADTQFRKEQLVSLFKIDPAHIEVLPIGADDEVYIYAKKKKTKLLNVMYYGLFSPAHGVEYIIQAAEFLKKIPEIRFHLVGNGNRFEAIKKLVEIKKLSNIQLYPNLTEANSLSTLQQADIFLGFLSDHPVIHQAIPNKVYQGLALGKAVISSDAIVMRQVFTHNKNIFLCKGADGRSLAQAIKSLHNDRMRLQKISENGYEMFQEMFTPKMVGFTLKEIAERVCK